MMLTNESYSSVSYVTHACPTCGAELILKNRFSKTVICRFCQSLVLLRQKDPIEVGKLGELTPDMSVLQIGCQGIFNEVPFEIIGRLKLTWRNGFWNEWYLNEENGKPAWITEAMGFYSYIYEQDFPEELFHNYFASERSLCLGDKLIFNKIPYVLTDIKNYLLEGIEGELPFNIKRNQKGKTFDFKSNTTQCVYIDLAEEGSPQEQSKRFFIGEHVSLDSLQIQHLREFDDW